MTKQQFSEAVKMIREDRVPAGIDDSILHGCGVKGFKPVVVTLEVAAQFIRYQCMQFNGQFDNEALNETFIILLKKAVII